MFLGITLYIVRDPSNLRTSPKPEIRNPNPFK